MISLAMDPGADILWDPMRFLSTEWEKLQKCVYKKLIKRNTKFNGSTIFTYGKY